jgi:hypothetical protein
MLQQSSAHVEFNGDSETFVNNKSSSKIDVSLILSKPSKFVLRVIRTQVVVVVVVVRLINFPIEYSKFIKFS